MSHHHWHGGERRCAGRRRGYLRGHRGTRRRGSARAAAGRTDRAHLPAASSPEAGDTEGRGQSPRASIPAIRDRVAQGAVKLILEPVFEADFQPGSFGYRPKRTAHGAVKRVAEAIVQRKTRVLDFDLRAYFDNVRHDRLLEKVAQRIDDADVMHLLKVMLKASGKKGVPQGGVISPPTILQNYPLTCR